MANPNNCALNPDSSLKDAKDIQFFNSPSDTHTIGVNNDISDVDNLPPPVASGSRLKGKSPAQCVAGKRVPKPSAKVCVSEGALDRVFSQVFSVGGHTGSSKNMSKSNQATTSARVSSTPQDASINEDIPELQDVHLICKEEGGEEEEKEEEEEQREEGDGEEEEDQMSKYEHMHKMGNNDCQVKHKHAPHGKDNCTRDICTVFNRETCVINGGEVDRHALNILPSACVMPTTTEEEDDSQTKLDGWVEGVPKWTSEGLLNHILEFIMSDDQAFHLIEKKSFCGILKYQRPSMKASDIPKCTKLQEEIIYKSKVVRKEIWPTERAKEC
ncbi:hypothetical protein DXG01_016673 [Tephrocybe rancida]|nr:hypothetical protein DXG01_016673 [Tephrocybe rancida]